jgi:DNA-binding PadR family transcriptional regulator
MWPWCCADDIAAPSVLIILAAGNTAVAAMLERPWRTSAVGSSAVTTLSSALAIVRRSVYNVGMSKQSMQEPTFLILTALAAGPQHGYGIMTDVAEISAGRVRLRAGTLYAALDRLGSDGAVAVEREEVVDGRLRRYYKLTPDGARLLADEAARLQANASTASRRLKGLAAGTAFAGGLA